MKQTAVECLIEQLTAIGQLEVPKGSNAVTSIIEQAKQMEKEQIENSYLDGFVERQFSIECKPEQYYNETFKSEKIETKQVERIPCPQCQGGGCPFCQGYGNILKL